MLNFQDKGASESCADPDPGNNDQPSEYIVELEALHCQLKAIQTHYGSLLEAIHEPVQLGAQLYSNGLLDSLVWKNIKSAGIVHTDKVCTLLDSVQSRMGFDPKAFEKFLEVLKEEPSTLCIAQSIQRTFGKLYCLCMCTLQKENSMFNVSIVTFYELSPDC